MCRFAWGQKRQDVYLLPSMYFICYHHIDYVYKFFCKFHIYTYHGVSSLGCIYIDTYYIVFIINLIKRMDKC